MIPIRALYAGLDRFIWNKPDSRKGPGVFKSADRAVLPQRIVDGVSLALGLVRLDAKESREK